MKINGNCKGNGSVRRLVLVATLSIGLGFCTQALALDHSSSYLLNLKTRTATGLGNGMVGASPVVGNGQAHIFITGPNGA